MDSDRHTTLPPGRLDDPLPSIPPPDYDEPLDVTNRLLSETAAATEDGRINLNLDSKIAQVFARFIDITEEHESSQCAPDYSLQASWSLPMNIVLQVVGSRGDVQPFVALGNELQKSGHRVRLATHNVFKKFVHDAGLEFYPIGGDPAELMAYMVKNPGLIPNMKTLREGQIKRKRQMISQMLHGCWRSCIEADPDTNAPFVAHAIIANPVSFAHIHCAQALSIPLHLVFTMPWSPTRAFPHPLANIQNTSTDPRLANYLSYGLVSALTWQGLGSVINEFRKSINLEVLPATEAPFLAETLKVPYTYCWSPALVPKPKDWADHIDVSGFIFRQAPAYEPTPALARFLAAGDPPVYIGFGSIVVEDPDQLLHTVLEAVKLLGIRAIISKGWSDFSNQDVSGNIFFLGDCPHEWLFQHVSSVVHHGGAGTTAAGLLNGKPTTVIPFFGDQPFWGERIAASGAGPSPIPYKKLTSSALAHAMKFCQTQEAKEAAYRISLQMKAERGVEAAVASFYRHLNAELLQCDLIPTLPAVYVITIKSKILKISACASEVLIKNDKIKSKQLKLYEPNPIFIENRRWDPLTSASSSTASISISALKALNSLWYEPYRSCEAAARKKYHASRSTDDEDPGEGSSTSVLPLTPPTNETGVGARISKHWGHMFRSAMVDTPLAITDGWRNMPRLYGESVPDRRPITGLKSSAIVTGQEFVRGIGAGLVDILVQPYKGYKEDGVLGLAAGIAKGTVGTVTKMSAGAVGLYAYPSQGIYRCMKDAAATHKVRKQVFSARRIHDLYFQRRDRLDEREILVAFERVVESEKGKWFGRRKTV